MTSIPYTEGGLSPIESGLISQKEDKSNKGTPNGYAPLDANSKVPAANLPAGFDLSGYQQTNEKNAANGYAGLGADGKIALSLLPDANALESEAIAFAIALG